MAKILVGKIDVTKIDKNKLFKGAKGTYADVVIFVNEEVDQYGNCASIQQSQSKEDREAGAPKIYLGNLKDLNDLKAEQAGSAPKKAEKSDDGMPF